MTFHPNSYAAVFTAVDRQTREDDEAARRAAESIPPILAAIFNPIPSDPSATQTAGALRAQWAGEQGE